MSKRGLLATAGVLVTAVVALLAVGIYMYIGDRKEEKEEPKMSVSEKTTVETAEDYEEVYKYLAEYRRKVEKSSTLDGGAALMVEDQTMENADLAAYGKSEADYSETNVRQAGVDEGDVVKTDGTYLYVLKDNRTEMSIVDTRDNEMKEVQIIKMKDSEWIQEIYVRDETKQMILVCSVDEGNTGQDVSPKVAAGSYWYAGNTEAVTYDISDPAVAKETGRVKQSGTYHSSRMTDGYLYLFSNYNVPWDAIEHIDKQKPETYIPLVNGEIVAERDICMPMIPSGKEYMVVTAVDMEAPDEITDSKAIFSQGGALYVSDKNIYYYETQWSMGSGMLTTDEQTTIRRIAYKDGELIPQAQGTIHGYIHDSFSIDEYDGYLRVVTTKKDTNEVYVLNMSLKEKAAIKGLAEDERVYSARFMGEMGYFVTFKETDPLFSVDFSDPEEPKVLGELKIPGFSDYLHPYGEGKLLGIGMNVEEKTMVTDGVKLTMFDISDPREVKEESTYILKNVYSTDVFYDYKAALVNVEKNIIGFAGYTEGGQEYFLFRYEEGNGFVCKMNEEINGNGTSSARGLFIDETLYVVQGNIIEAYSLTEYEKTDDLIL